MNPTIRRIIINIIFGLQVLLIFLFFFEDRIALPAWLQVVGRLHPLVLHLPIGFFILILIMMLFAGAISKFINRNPTLQMLALSFLIAIVIMLVAEGFHQHISKSYIYTMIAFSLLVEILNMRMRKNRESIRLHGSDALERQEQEDEKI